MKMHENWSENLIITTPTTSCIYFLPKIHKPNNPGRPIVSACSCPTDLISRYLDKIMAPIVKTTGIIFSQPPLISFKRDKNRGNFWSEVHSKLMTNPALLNALAHDAKPQVAQALSQALSQ